ncbi:MAG TPA: hypothetical protein VLA62_02485 [Solirubrobacterales bacterium]|nr:hypothetical protein [Solirubrobacterales bacterium]
MARRGDYLKAAAALISAIGEDRSALAGGLAVWAHGYVRGTRDVDVIVAVSLEEARGLLAARGIRAVLRRGDPLERGFSCLKGEIGVVAFDVLPQLVAVPWERAISLDVAGGRLRVIDLATLLELKLKAGGAKDLMDVAMLVRLHPEQEERARRLSVAYRVKGDLDRWLSDRRVEAEARAIAEQERTTTRRGRSRGRPH